MYNCFWNLLHDGKSSKNKTQDRGLASGCPLSPPTGRVTVGVIIECKYDCIEICIFWSAHSWFTWQDQGNATCAHSPVLGAVSESAQSKHHASKTAQHCQQHEGPCGIPEGWKQKGQNHVHMLNIHLHLHWLCSSCCLTKKSQNLPWIWLFV